MKKKTLTCIVCPKGCQIKATVEEHPFIKVIDIKGNLCQKGKEWASQELIKPMRTITTSILIEGGDCHLVSIKTSSAVPLNNVFEVMKAIKSIKIKAPITIGDVIIKKPARTRCNIIATRNVMRQP